MRVFENKLEQFFNCPKNTTRREALLLNRLAYDVQLAAALHNYYLKVYISDVDDNGYDVIFDSEMVTRKLQIKSVMSTSTTDTWGISKGLIKPSMESKKNMSAWSHIDTEGIEGGVVIQQVHLQKESIEIKYFYTDIWLLTASAWRLIGSERQSKAASKYIRTLSGFDYHEKKETPLTLFFEPHNVECLIGVMGLSSRYDYPLHRYLMRERYNSKIGTKEQIDIRIQNELSKFGAMYRKPLLGQL